MGEKEALGQKNRYPLIRSGLNLSGVMSPASKALIVLKALPEVGAFHSLPSCAPEYTVTASPGFLNENEESWFKLVPLMKTSAE